MRQKESLLQWLGLLGLVSLLFYAAAVVFAPLAYPGYVWAQQAVSDLSASNALSLQLWNQLSSLYSLCGIVSIMMVCVFVQGILNRLLRLGIYLFAAMNWVSAVGYASFPLNDRGYAGTFQDLMHIVVTSGVVGLSIVALLLYIIGGLRKRTYTSLGVLAAVTLLVMFKGPMCVGLAPKSLLGVFESFSEFTAIVKTYKSDRLKNKHRLSHPLRRVLFLSDGCIKVFPSRPGSNKNRLLNRMEHNSCFLSYLFILTIFE